MVQALGQISRLKGFFRSGLNYSNYEQMISIAKRKASGCLPKDVISCVTSNGVSNKSAEQGVEKILNETVDILGEINKLERQCVNRMNLNTSKKRYEHFSMKGDLKGFLRLDSLYKEKEIETIIKAEEKFLNGIKKYVPDVQNVIITPIGSGVFGNVYKLQVLNKDGKQIFDDKVLKVYRENTIITHLIRKNKRFMDSLSDEKLVEQHLKEHKMSRNSHSEINASELRQDVQEQLEFCETCEKEEKRFNGAMAEANISEFLRFFTGHKVKPEEGIAIPSYFGLGDTKYAFGEFIGKERKAKRNFDFKRLFVEPTDFENNTGNGINGICIDMGGIMPITELGKEIFTVKENMRILKSILSSPEDKRKIALEEYKKSGILSKEVISQIEQIL